MPLTHGAPAPVPPHKDAFHPTWRAIQDGIQDAPLQEVLERMRPGIETTRRWMDILETHLRKQQGSPDCAGKSTASPASSGPHHAGRSSASPDSSPAASLVGKRKDSGDEEQGLSPRTDSLSSIDQDKEPNICLPEAKKHPQMSAPSPMSPGSPDDGIVVEEIQESRTLRLTASSSASNLRQAWLDGPLAKQSAVRGGGLGPKLPMRVEWSITLLIPILVALVNAFIAWSSHATFDLKFFIFEKAVKSGGALTGALANAAYCVVCAAGAAFLVSHLSPVSAGSGLPESKGFLNGNTISGMFKVQSLVVRIFGIILSLTASFPIGREGPMVAIGGTLGYFVAHILSRPWVRLFVDTSTTSDHETTCPIMDEERFAEMKRIGFILGGAAGISTAFNAPIGGILYIFEEATLTTWPPSLTFRAGVSSVFGALLARSLYNLKGENVHKLLEFTPSRASWRWLDLPVFMALAIVLGFYSSMFSKVLTRVWIARRKRPARSQKIRDACLYCLICALVFSLVPLCVNCITDPHHENHGLEYIQHACPDGQANEVATLLMKSAEPTIVHLFARDMPPMQGEALLLVLVVYTVFAAGMAGLAVPMGNFLPIMLMGATSGRLLGEFLNSAMMVELCETLALPRLADPGVYALVGSAAMLSGFTHMTVAIVVILVETAHDLDLVSPLMASLFLANTISRWYQSHSYDHSLILLKGVPYLDAEVPPEMNRPGLSAGDLCEAVPGEAKLPPQASPHSVEEALKSKLTHFPIVEDGLCIGLCPRSRLESAMRARLKEPEMVKSPPLSPKGRLSEAFHIDEHASHSRHEILDDLIRRFWSGRPDANGIEAFGDQIEEDDEVNLKSMMDPSPYTLFVDMPARRLYPLFTKVGTTTACVVTRNGEFVGLMSSKQLISAATAAIRSRGSTAAASTM